MALGKAPLGTQGAASSQSPTEQATSTTQAAEPSTQAVSTLPIPGSSPGSVPSEAVVLHSRDAMSPVLRPSFSPPEGPPPSSISFSFGAFVLTPSVQISSPNPVTIENTVTASPTVQVSFVSIV